MQDMIDRDAPRAGERVLQDMPGTEAGLVFIGHIETPFASRDDCPRQGRADGPVCTLVLDPRFAPALDGIDRFEQLELLYWLHEARRDLLSQSPRSDGRTRGTFSLRSPVRPNPIGTSIVTLVARDAHRVTVRGLDCLNGTPLLDIKPLRCAYSPLAPAKPGV